MIDFNRGDAPIMVAFIIALFVSSSVVLTFISYKMYGLYKHNPKNFIPAMNGIVGYYILFVIIGFIILATFSGYNIIHYFTS